MSHTHLHLFKENFKFSAAHFLIFDHLRAERLHGHNYGVSLDLSFDLYDAAQDRRGPDKTGLGYSIDFADIKKVLKELLDEWDEHVLLPGLHPEVKTEIQGPGLHVHFRERFYVFPVDEVLVLPITNTSVEQLSLLLARKLKARLTHPEIQRIAISVEETKGQSASAELRAPLW